jgi:hypothetical protein
MRSLVWVASSLAYGTLILVPIVVRLASGHEFGGDVGEYLLTSHQLLTSTAASDRYLFPALPALYVPGSASNWSYVVSYAAADLVSGLLTLALVAGAGLLGYSLHRSAVSAGASAGIVGTFFLTLEEIGWGAQGQILAFALGVTAVALLLRTQLDPRPPRVVYGVALLLGAAVLTESYAAAYFVLWILILLVVELGRRALTRESLRAYWPVIALPAAALAVVSVTGGSAAASVVRYPILPYVLSPGPLLNAFFQIDFGNIANAFACLLLLGTFAVFAVLGRTWTRRDAVVALSALLAFAVEVLVLTPIVYWDRAPYFLAFPLAIASAAMAPAALTSRAARSQLPPARPHRWKLRLRRSRWVDVAGSVVVAGALLTQTVVAVDTYPGILSFYDIDATSLSALTWLRGDTGGLLSAAPEGQTFAIAYATERPIFPRTQPVWFDNAPEQQAAILASKLVAGRQWIDAGALTVVDTGSPSNTSSPAVFASEYPYFVNLFDLTESEGGTFATSDPGTALDRSGVAAPLSAPAAAFIDNDTLPTYNVTKQTSVSANGTVAVDLTFASTNGTSGPTYVDLQVPQADLDSSAPHLDAVEMSESFGMVGSISVAFSSRATLTGTPNATVAPPDVSVTQDFPTVSWEVAPRAGFTGRSWNVTLFLEVGVGTATAPRLVSESDELASNGIGWALVDVSTDPSLVPRFAFDPMFVTYWTSPTYTIYRVT